MGVARAGHVALATGDLSGHYRGKGHAFLSGSSGRARLEVIGRVSPPEVTVFKQFMICADGSTSRR